MYQILWIYIISFRRVVVNTTVLVYLVDEEHRHEEGRPLLVQVNEQTAAVYLNYSHFLVKVVILKFQ